MIDNYAVIGSTSVTGEINTLNNNSQNQQTTADTDLIITKSTTSTTSIIGTLVTWVVDYVNEGPQTAYDVTVHDLIPDGLSYESSSSIPDARADIA